LTSEEEAKTKAQAFREKGYSAFYVPATVGGKTWYRVNVGQFETAKEAKDYRTKLAKDSSFGSAIVQKISP
jgi:septal ring-binding cell division protein DamX